MMRLIDADALREAMYHEAFEKNSDMQKWESGCWIRYKMFENCIEDAPTIDPKKVIEDYCIPRNLMVVAAECFRLFTEPKPVEVGADYYKTAYNEGYADGYDNAIEHVTEMLKNCTPNGGAHKQPGKDPEKEGTL